MQKAGRAARMPTPLGYGNSLTTFRQRGSSGFEEIVCRDLSRNKAKSVFAPYVGFGVLMTSKLGTNVILMKYVAAISPMKDSKS